MCFLLTAPPQLTFAVAVDFSRASNSGFRVSHTQNQCHCPSLETPAWGCWCALLRGLASFSMSSPTLSPLFLQPWRPELLPAVIPSKPQYSPLAFRFSNPWWTIHPSPHYMSTFIGMLGIQCNDYIHTCRYICIVYVFAYVSVSICIWICISVVSTGTCEQFFILNYMLKWLMWFLFSDRTLSDPTCKILFP